jgi:hypothetical protein
LTKSKREKKKARHGTKRQKALTKIPGSEHTVSKRRNERRGVLKSEWRKKVKRVQ